MIENLLPFQENRDGKLYIEGIAAIHLAEQYGTPLYVISESRIREQYRKISNTLKALYNNSRVYYSAKANTNISVLKILESEGSFLDVVSAGEAYTAKKAGFSNDRLLFTGTNISNDELQCLLNEDIPLNVDSLSLLRRILEFTTPNFISFRINPEIGAGHHSHVVTAGQKSKFGLWEQDIIAAYKQALASGVEKFGMQMHIGAGNLNAQPFLLALERMLVLAQKVRQEVGIQFSLFDIGGGYGVPYRPNEKEIDVEHFFRELLSLFKTRISDFDLGHPIFCIEPGRYIVADSTVLLTRVNTLKTTPYKQYVGVDAGFNTLIRPILYGSYHHILVANKLNALENTLYDIAGPICESGDLLATERLLPEIEEGDLLTVMHAGAYGFSMSSSYNSRPRSAEVLVREGKSTLVRERETFDDILMKQNFAGWLEK